MNRRTEFRDTLIAVLVEAGVTEYRIKIGKKHHRLYFTVEGVERFYVYPGTPSDCRALPNAITDLRRMLPVCDTPKRTIRTFRPRRDKAPSRRPPMPETFTPGPDPWEPLRRRLMLPLPWWRRRRNSPWREKLNV